MLTPSSVNRTFIPKGWSGIKNPHWRPSQNKDRKNKILSELGAKLIDAEISGKVVTILTYDKKTVRIYGRTIALEILFNRLNLSIGKAINCADWSNLTRWEKGFFVRLKEFVPTAENNEWVALIGFKVCPLSDAVIFGK